MLQEGINSNVLAGCHSHMSTYGSKPKCRLLSTHVGLGSTSLMKRARWRGRSTGLQENTGSRSGGFSISILSAAFVLM